MKYAVKGDTLTVWPEGELDHHSASKVKGELEALLEKYRIKRLILDLKQLTFMDSSGIGIVLGRYNTMSKRGGKILIRNPCSRVDRIFAMSGLYQIIEKQ